MNKDGTCSPSPGAGVAGQQEGAALNRGALCHSGVFLLRPLMTLPSCGSLRHFSPDTSWAGGHRAGLRKLEGGREAQSSSAGYPVRIPEVTPSPLFDAPQRCSTSGAPGRRRYGSRWPSTSAGTRRRAAELRTSPLPPCRHPPSSPPSPSWSPTAWSWPLSLAPRRDRLWWAWHSPPQRSATAPAPGGLQTLLLRCLQPVGSFLPPG